MKGYMSGSELRQYLHISTRKMKYLMDHNYIPHENTGHATHKYRVLKEDAEKFKFRMDNEVGFLAELTDCANKYEILSRSILTRCSLQLILFKLSVQTTPIHLTLTITMMYGR